MPWRPPEVTRLQWVWWQAVNMVGQIGGELQTRCDRSLDVVVRCEADDGHQFVDLDEWAYCSRCEASQLAASA